MPPACEKCGLEPESGNAFTKVRKTFKTKREILCPACIKKRESSEGKITFLWIGLITAILVVLSPKSLGDPFPRALINLGIALYLISPLSVLAHELAHAVVGRICRFRIFSVEMGWDGRELINTRIHGTRWILRWFPSSGICRMAPPSPHRLRLRLFLAIAAAPFINLAIAGLIAYAEPRDSLWSLQPLALGFNPLYLLFWTNLFIAFKSLNPKRYHSAIGVLFSDGMQLQMLLKNDQTLLDETHKAFFILEAGELLHAEHISEAKAVVARGLKLYPGDAGLEVTLAVIQYQLGQITTSLDTLDTVLENIDKESPHVATIKNNIAYFSAVLGDESLYARADAYSTEALQSFQTVSAFMGTRGAVLVRLGEFEKGLDYLKKSIKESSVKVHRENLAWIALAHCKLGNAEEARLYLRQAQAICPNFLLINEVIRSLDSSDLP